MLTIAAIANVFNEHNALPGWLEMATDFFDEVIVVNAGPGGARSADGTIEIVEQWGVRIVFDNIDEGFGALRTRMVTMPATDWTMILDADERFHRHAPVLSWDHEGRASIIGVYDQGAVLRKLIEQPVDMIVAGRRHWHDFTWKRPTQDWVGIPDWQARIVRNRHGLGYRAEVKMHEQAIDHATGRCPRWFHPESPAVCRVFFDHYHMLFKAMEPDQRAHDIRIYDALCAGLPIPAE